MVEHQHAAAEAIGAYLEGCTISGESVGTNRPGHILSWCGRCIVVLAIIKNDLKTHIGALRKVLAGLVRSEIAVAYALQIAIGRAG